MKILSPEEITDIPVSGSRQVYFTPSYTCNSNCIMCGVAKWKRDSRQSFSLEDSKKLIDNMNLNPGDAVELSGGEPTIYKGFSDLVSYTKETYGARIVVLSHGRTLKNRNFVKSLVGKGIDRFVIPLFSNKPEIHDYITQVQGSFDETTTGFRNLEDLGISFSIKFITMAPNYKDALNTYLYKQKYFHNARFIISGYQLMGEAITNDTAVSVKHSEVAPEIEKVLEAAERNNEVVPVFMFPMCQLDPSFWSTYGVGVWHEEVVAPDKNQINLSTELNYEEKHPSCEPCILKRRCVWAWRKYVEKYGSSELTPFITKSEHADVRNKEL